MADVVVARPRHQRTHTGVGRHQAKQLAEEFPSPLRQAWQKYHPAEFSDKEGFEREFVRAVETTLARGMFNCDDLAAYQATSHAVKDRLISAWNETQTTFTLEDPKRVYYFSFEFLMGRTLVSKLQ